MEDHVADLELRLFGCVRQGDPVEREAFVRRQVNAGDEAKGDPVTVFLDQHVKPVLASFDLSHDALLEDLEANSQAVSVEAEIKAKLIALGIARDENETLWERLEDMRARLALFYSELDRLEGPSVDPLLKRIVRIGPTRGFFVEFCAKNVDKDHDVDKVAPAAGKIVDCSTGQVLDKALYDYEQTAGAVVLNAMRKLVARAKTEQKAVADLVPGTITFSLAQMRASLGVLDQGCPVHDIAACLGAHDVVIEAHHDGHEAHTKAVQVLRSKFDYFSKMLQTLEKDPEAVACATVLQRIVLVSREIPNEADKRFDSYAEWFNYKVGQLDRGLSPLSADF